MTDQKYNAAILVVSDTASRDASTDKCGPILTDVFNKEGNGKWVVAETKIVPDNVTDIQRSIMQWADGQDYINLIITSGGTGFAIKDNTPEVLTPI